MKYFLPACLLALLFLSAAPRISYAQSPGLPQERTSQLFEAFRTGRSDGLLPLLADSCRVEGYRGEMGLRILQALILQSGPADSLRMLDARPTDAGCDVTVEICKGGSARTASFSLDREGLFSEFSLAGTVQVVSAALTPLAVAPFCEMSFEIRNGFIVLHGICVDGRPGTFILDSGCRRTRFNSASPVVWGASVAEGLTGSRGAAHSDVRSVQVVEIDSLVVGGNRFKARASASDLTPQAGNIGLDELTGLIGADLLSLFETHIDYARKTVSFYALDGDGYAAGAPEPEMRFAFELLNGYLPCFEAAAGDLRLRMVFDTGAQVCCLAPDAAGRLGAGFRRGRSKVLLDAAASAEVGSGRLARLEWCGVRKRRLRMVVPPDLSRLGDMDGIVGYPLVAGRHVSLNYVRRELGVY